MKKYETQIMEEFIKYWRKKEKFTEISRIGNLPKHNKASIWVNEKGEEREEPHFHVILSNRIVLRLKFKDLKSLDTIELDSTLLKELKAWFNQPSKEDSNITNLQGSLYVWNTQEHGRRKIKLSDLKWFRNEE